MAINDYDQLTSMELDTLREVGSIGTGNAATALSALIGEQVRIKNPEVRIMGYNEAIEWIGGPEEITAGVLVGMSGQITGIMLSVQQLEFVNLVLGNMMGTHTEDYASLGEIESSALVEAPIRTTSRWSPAYSLSPGGISMRPCLSGSTSAAFENITRWRTLAWAGGMAAMFSASRRNCSSDSSIRQPSLPVLT